MIAFACSSCGQSLEVRDEFAPKPCKCPRCGQVQQVPPPVTFSVNASTRLPAQPPVARPSVVSPAEQLSVFPGGSGSSAPLPGGGHAVEAASSCPACGQQPNADTVVLAIKPVAGAETVLPE